MCRSCGAAHAAGVGHRLAAASHSSGLPTAGRASSASLNTHPAMTLVYTYLLADETAQSESLGGAISLASSIQVHHIDLSRFTALWGEAHVIGVVQVSQYVLTCAGAWQCAGYRTCTRSQSQARQRRGLHARQLARHSTPHTCTEAWSLASIRRLVQELYIASNQSGVCARIAPHAGSSPLTAAHRDSQPARQAARPARQIAGAAVISSPPASHSLVASPDTGLSQHQCVAWSPWCTHAGSRKCLRASMGYAVEK